MISVPINSIDAIVSSMTLKQNQSDAISLNLPKNWESIIIVFLVSLVGYLAYWVTTYAWNDITTRISNTSAEVARVQTTLDKALTAFDSVKTSLQDQRVSIAALETRILNFEKPRYESKAKAMGFKNPQIVAASFQTNQTFESKTKTTSGDYYIKYTILSYDISRKTLSLKLDAILPNNTTFRNNELIFTNVSAGQTVDISLSARAPRILLQILDLPTPTSAILAIGEKTDSSDKAS